MTNLKGIDLWEEAKKWIPGGNHLLSKRPEMYTTKDWPTYYKKAKGCTVEDLDGKEFIDVTISGVGTCPLGFSDSDVDEAVITAVKSGNLTTLNVPEAIELAKVFCEIHPWAEMVRYARSGGEAMAITARIIRAATRKDKIMICGYHGWHDWYLAANLDNVHALDNHLFKGLEPIGIPQGLKNTIIPFSYNNFEQFQELYEANKNEIAGIIMEPIRTEWPKNDFLHKIREVTAKDQLPLVFDEITAGFRLGAGGSHLKLGVNPDIAVFAKAMSNGYPMAAVVGTERYMQAAEKTFISSTYWTDRIGPVAALATIKKYQALDVGKHLTSIGEKVQAGWLEIGKKLNLEIEVCGIPPLSRWLIKTENSDDIHDQIAISMVKRGYLTSKLFYVTLAHTEEIVDRYLEELESSIRESLSAKV